MEIRIIYHRYTRQGGYNHVGYVVESKERSVSHCANDSVVVVQKRYRQFLALFRKLQKNDRAARGLPFPPKKVMMDCYHRQKRQESLESFLVEAVGLCQAKHDTKSNFNMSLVRAFLNLSSTGISCTVTSFGRRVVEDDKDTKVHYKIEVVDKNGRKTALYKRYSDFLALKKRVGDDLKKKVNMTVEFPRKKLPGSSVASLRARRQGLEDWLTTLNCCVPQSPEVEAELFNFLGLNEDGLIVSDSGLDDPKRLLNTQEDSGDAVRDYANVESPRDDYASAESPKDDEVKTVAAADGAVGEQKKKKKKKSTSSHKVRRKIGKGLSKLGLSTKKKKSRQESKKAEHADDVLTLLEANEETMEASDVAEVWLEKMVTAEGRSDRMGRVAIETVLKFSNSHSCVIAVLECLYLRTRNLPNLDFKDFVARGGVAAVCFSIKFNFYDKQHVTHMIKLLFELAAFDTDAVQKALPGYAKQILKNQCWEAREELGEGASDILSTIIQLCYA